MRNRLRFENDSPEGVGRQLLSVNSHVFVAFARSLALSLGLSTTLMVTANAAANAAQASDDPSLLRRQALMYYLEQKSSAPAYAFNNAEIVYKQAIESAEAKYGKNSSYVASLYYELGSLALDNKVFKRAHDYILDAIRINPNSITSRLAMAKLYGLENRPVDAVAQINAALTRHPKSPEARAALVAWLQTQHQNASAVKESATLVAMSPRAA